MLDPFDAPEDGHARAVLSRVLPEWLRAKRLPIVITLGVLLAAIAIGSLWLNQGGEFAIVPNQAASTAAAPVAGSGVKQPDNEPAAAQADAAASAAADAAGATDASGAGSVVYVTGAVNAPGVVELPAGARIGDAVKAAGGFAPDAEAAAVNLAQFALDGCQIHIPTHEEAVNGCLPPSGATGTDAGPSLGAAQAQRTADGATQAAPAGAQGQNAAKSALVNINSASLGTLQTLKGIGPATAQKIIDYRSAHGPFKSIEELRNVSGIGEKKYAAIAGQICV
jgi:competence protein ComEA